MTEATTSTFSPTDIVNAKLPGCKDLQMLAVDVEGIIQEVCPMDKIFKRVSPPDLQVLDALPINSKQRKFSAFTSKALFSTRRSEVLTQLSFYYH